MAVRSDEDTWQIQLVWEPDLSPEQMAALLLHEIAHCHFDHDGWNEDGTRRHEDEREANELLDHWLDQVRELGRRGC
jgi:predicted metal-dependent peptidase